MSKKIRLKGEEGFTLLEAIISIAAIAVVSGFILEMFVLSGNVNIKSRDMDFGSTVAVNAVELFKKQESPDNYTHESFFESGAVNSDNNGQIHILKGYDKDFNETPVSWGDDAPPPENVKFILSVTVDKKETEGMYSVSAAVLDYKRFPSVSEVIRINAEKYFGLRA